MLPWHGQLIVPPTTSLTVHPALVQIAEKPLKTPSVGWVSTTSPMILPDPTGTSVFLAIAFAGSAGDAGTDPAVVGAAAGFLP